MINKIIFYLYILFRKQKKFFFFYSFLLLLLIIAQDKNTKEQVSIKLEKEDNEEIRSLEREVQILTRL